MKVICFEKFGAAAEVLQSRDFEKPEVGPGEVLVRVHTSGVNPSDVKKRAGAFPNLLDDGPVIPHSDGAGIIEAVGDGVADTRLGERVWLYQAQFGRRFGTLAEYVMIPSERAPTLPEQASFEVGACMGIPAMTAHRCVTGDGPVSGQTVLVTGGAGRVGFYAIQWAVAGGAEVIATASNAKDESMCLALGAKAVCNHRLANWGSEVLAANRGQPVDRVVDVEFGVNLPEVLNCIRTGGTISTYSSTQEKEPSIPFLRMMYLDLTVHMVIVYDMPEAAKQMAVADINEALLRETLEHRVAETFPMSRAAAAHELIEQGSIRGCVVIETRE